MTHARYLDAWLITLREYPWEGLEEHHRRTMEAVLQPGDQVLIRGDESMGGPPWTWTGARSTGEVYTVNGDSVDVLLPNGAIEPFDIGMLEVDRTDPVAHESHYVYRAVS